LPKGVNILTQGHIVAEGLKDYLVRHPEMEIRISKTNLINFLTTDSTELFDSHASLFFGQEVKSKHLAIN
jgi:glutamate racemase